MKWIVIVPLFLLSTIVLHESGHALTAYVLGVENISIRIWPGFTLFSTFSDYEYLMRLQSPMTGVASTDLFFLPETFSQMDGGLCMLMGSGVTFIISLICLFWYVVYRPSGKQQACCIAGMLLVYDAFTYVIFPTVFGVRHLIVIGGNKPEPLIALEYLGVETMAINVFICWLIAQVVVTGWLLCFRTQNAGMVNNAVRPFFRAPG
ncbi:hypothetical protein [Alteromonas sp. H39]|uniref:hypothetical protein n=1 Tax=Alteromonas sp. H39 TaxID=3389876 RepID=UPI0039E06CE5